MNRQKCYETFACRLLVGMTQCGCQLTQAMCGWHYKARPLVITCSSLFINIAVDESSITNLCLIGHHINTAELQLHVVPENDEKATFTLRWQVADILTYCQRVNIAAAVQYLSSRWLV